MEDTGMTKPKSSPLEPFSYQKKSGIWMTQTTTTRTREWSSLPILSRLSKKPNMNSPSYAVPYPREDTPMEVDLEDEVFDEITPTIEVETNHTAANLFLARAGSGAVTATQTTGSPVLRKNQTPMATRVINEVPPTVSNTTTTVPNIPTTTATRPTIAETWTAPTIIVDSNGAHLQRPLQHSIRRYTSGWPPDPVLTNWKKVTTHPWPLSVMSQGYQIQWSSSPQPWKPHQLKMNPEETQAVEAAVTTFLQSGIIEISPNQDKRFLSNFFTVQEPNKRRPILDCQKLSKFVQCHHFKMEGIPALRELIDKDDFICKIDLKDAYVVVPIHADSKKYLSFMHRNTVYQYRSLAFGLSVAPRVFSKLMRYAIEPLRAQGLRLVYYLDDVCILAKTKKEMARVTHTIISHLTSLGFMINTEKSTLIPLQVQEFLGFQFNTKQMTMRVPQKKMTKLYTRVRTKP